VVVTQAFHLPRATYTARAMGIDAVGVEADKHVYAGVKFNELREVPARVKAFMQIHLLKSKPRFLGDTLPIEGDGRITHDDFAQSGSSTK
jgi:SanA protein